MSSKLLAVNIIPSVTNVQRIICIEPSPKLEPRHHLNPVGPHICDQCNSLFDATTNLIQHQLSTHPTTFCVLCQKKLSSKTKWKRHVNSVHGFGQVFKCPFCDKTGYREDLIFTHIMTTHKVFPCKDCKQAFPSKNTLDEHKAIAH